MPRTRCHGLESPPICAMIYSAHQNISPLWTWRNGVSTVRWRWFTDHELCLDLFKTLGWLSNMSSSIIRFFTCQILPFNISYTYYKNHSTDTLNMCGNNHDRHWIITIRTYQNYVPTGVPHGFPQHHSTDFLVKNHWTTSMTTIGW